MRSAFKVVAWGLFCFYGTGLWASAAAPLRAAYIPPDNCSVSLEIASQPELVERLPLEYRQVQTEGIFIPASEARLQSLKIQAAEFQRKNELGFDASALGIQRVLESDISIWASARAGHAVDYEGLTSLAREEFLRNTSDASAQDLIKKLKKIGYDGVAPLAIQTSAAGNWRRGGQISKGLLPYNLAQSMGAGFKDFLLLSHYFNGHSKQREQLAQNPEFLSANWVERAGATEIQEELARRVILNSKEPEAMTAVVAKLAQAAVLSRVMKRYIHLEFPTSFATHTRIREGIEWFKAHYKEKIFHPITEVNEFITGSLSQYFKADAILNETHLLGFQLETYPFRAGPELEWATEEAKNGEGAATLHHALEVTGRRLQLELRGVKHITFQNIEVMAIHLMNQYGAFLKSDSSMAFVVIPEDPSKKLSGGYPYRVYDQGQWKNRMLEGIAVPKALKKSVPGGVFNTNTAFWDIRIQPVPEEIDFEPKAGTHSQLIVPKASLGLLSYTNDTSFIGGTFGTDYLDLKLVEQFESSGPSYMDLIHLMFHSNYLLSNP